MKNKNLQATSSIEAGDCLVVTTGSFSSVCGMRPRSAEYQLFLPANDVILELMPGNDAFRVAGGRLLLLASDVAPRLLAGACGVPADGEVVLLRFPADLLGERLLGKNQLQPIQELLEKSRNGLLFEHMFGSTTGGGSGAAAEAAVGVAGAGGGVGSAVGGGVEVGVTLRGQVLGLREKKGFAVMLGLLAFLNQLARMPHRQLPEGEPEKKPPATVAGAASQTNLDTAMAYMKANYSKPITLDDVARTARMTRGAFCRSIRKKTGKTYAESLSEIRLGHICRLLLETSENVSEIAYKTGYQNIHHFHRSFKRQKGCTPKEFRDLFCSPR